MMYMNKTPLIVLTAISLAFFPSARASVTVSSAVGGAPAGASRVNFDNLALGSQSGATASGPSGSVIVTTSGNAQIVAGTTNPLYAAPVLTGGNGSGFAAGGLNQADGVDGTKYVTAGNVSGGGSVEVRLPGSHTYLGLLWGSADKGQNDITNRLELFNGLVSVGVVTGTDVVAVVVPGSQGPDGTAYVNINSTLPFNRVVASSAPLNGFTFEFDNLAYGCSGCVLTQGYWKNHSSAWPVSNLTLGTVSYTKAQLLTILGQPVKGNGLVSLAHQLIAAKLNIATGACAPSDVVGAIGAADLLLGGLVVPPVGSGTAPTSLTSGLVSVLDDYNNGLSAGGPAHCDD